MQISTNWSVSHLRHWRPPVARSGYYLYRFTGRSWFKSKQSALRSILPNANIHHNEKRPGRGHGPTPREHVGSHFSARCIQRTVTNGACWEHCKCQPCPRRDVTHGSTTYVDGESMFFSPAKQKHTVSNERAEESQLLIAVTIEKVSGTYEVMDTKGSLSNEGRIYDKEEFWGRDGGHHEQSHNREIVLTVN